MKQIKILIALSALIMQPMFGMSALKDMQNRIAKQQLRAAQKRGGKLGVSFKGGTAEPTSELKRKGQSEEFEKELRAVIGEQKQKREKRLATEKASGQAPAILKEFAQEKLAEIKELQKEMVVNSLMIWEMFRNEESLENDDEKNTKAKNIYSDLSLLVKEDGDIYYLLSAYREELELYKKNAEYKANTDSNVEQLGKILDDLVLDDPINPEVSRLYQANVKKELDDLFKGANTYEKVLKTAQIIQTNWNLKVAKIQKDLKTAAEKGNIGGGQKSIRRIYTDYNSYLFHKKIAEWQMLFDRIQPYAKNIGKTADALEKEFPKL